MSRIIYIPSTPKISYLNSIIKEEKSISEISKESEKKLMENRMEIMKPS